MEVSEQREASERQAAELRGSLGASLEARGVLEAQLEAMAQVRGGGVRPCGLWCECVGRGPGRWEASCVVGGACAAHNLLLHPRQAGVRFLIVHVC